RGLGDVDQTPGRRLQAVLPERGALRGHVRRPMRGVCATTLALGTGNVAGALCFDESAGHSGTELAAASDARLCHRLLPGEPEQFIQPDRSALFPVLRRASPAHDRGGNPVLPPALHGRILSALFLADAP